MLEGGLGLMAEGLGFRPPGVLACKPAAKGRGESGSL